MVPFSGARWTRSQSAPPCPGAWSYRILGRFPLPAASVERQQQQQEQQVAVPQAGWPRPDGGIVLVQPHPPGCCVHPQYGHLNTPPQDGDLNAPAAIAPVPDDLVHNNPICSHRLPDTNHAAQSTCHQPRYPPQYPIRDHAHVHPTAHGTHHQPHQPPLQVHSHSAYPPPPPPGEQFSAPQTNLAGVPLKPGSLHPHRYSGCQSSHPQNDRQYQNLHSPRRHPTQQQHYRHPQGVPSAPQGPTWNAVNSQQAGPGSGAPPHTQPTINAPLEGQGTLERPFIIHTPADGTNLIGTSPGRPHSNTTLGMQPLQAQETQILPPSASNPILELKPQLAPPLNINTGTNAFSTTRNPSSAPKRTRKSYTREYKLKALNLLNGERPDGKGGTVPASDTWVSRQVGVTRKVLRGWKAQEERLRASRKGSRRVRVGRNRERRPAGNGKERTDNGKGREIEAHGASVIPVDSRGTPEGPQEIETSSEDEEDTEIHTPGGLQSTEDEDEGGNDDPHEFRTARTERQVSVS
ncbi:hypothetical protein L211DRAFT_837023 [Terfezia boudieri ATCC MYA-4762]|uniref:Uncharacterized protein n=1 Tax=Terfezia boudieri ATCC MYA-4762 TaxID=1051890 RepID=A0A3N4M4C3_9PEZI|nr:hypothetical protein L211DRAFT_837023 [Terfezia boudieri ATCC MYA-4762]